MVTFLRIFEFAVVPVAVACVTAGLGAWAVVRSHRQALTGLDDRNTDQHNQNSALLTHLSGQIGGIDTKIDRIDTRVDSLGLWASSHELDHLKAEKRVTQSRRDIPG